jgi:hypothetical protein
LIDFQVRWNSYTVFGLWKVRGSSGEARTGLGITFAVLGVEEDEDAEAKVDAEAEAKVVEDEEVEAEEADPTTHPEEDPEEE